MYELRNLRIFHSSFIEKQILVKSVSVLGLGDLALMQMEILSKQLSFWAAQQSSGLWFDGTLVRS